MDEQRITCVGGRFLYRESVGWGLDPSHGILTGNTHFPIASGALRQYDASFRVFEVVPLQIINFQ
jgi:hypothetical protein